MEQFGVFLLVGLTAGGLGCMALQGGLLTSLVAQNSTNNQRTQWLPVVLFALVRLASYTATGALLGFLGSMLRLSDTATLLFQLMASLFMVATALNLLQVHPIFRYVAIQPPAFVRKVAKRATGRTDWLAPAFLGMITIFLPCGVTQAVALLAINSGSATEGALMLGAFILGTTPLVLAFGLVASVAQAKFDRLFRVIAATVLIIIGLYGLNGVLVALDAPFSAQKIYRLAGFNATHTQNTSTAEVVDGVQVVTIFITNSGYSPQTFSVQQGIPVKLILQSNDAYSCALAFRFPEFGISTFLESTDRQAFLFTPENKGVYTFTCSMGMYTGEMVVL